MESSTSSNGYNAAELMAWTEAHLSAAEIAQIWAERAHALAAEPTDEATGTTLDLLVLQLGNERYAVHVTNVHEIYPLAQLTPVPRTPNFVAGVFSARGRILSVVDLWTFLERPPHEKLTSDQTKIVVMVNTNPNSPTYQMEVGILADDVVDVVTVFQDDIEPPLTSQAATRTDYVEGVTTDMLLVLNMNALLEDDRLIIQQ